MRLKTDLPPRKCIVCGKEFIPKTTTSSCCSINCTKQAYKMRKQQEKENEELKKLIGHIPQEKEVLSVKEACLLFNISEKTLHRIIKKGAIPSMNLGTRLTKVMRKDLETRFSARTTISPQKTIKVKKLYSLEPEDCYTIGEIQEKFRVSESTVYKLIRRESIPIRQIGKFVYAPKEDINELFK